MIDHTSASARGRRKGAGASRWDQRELAARGHKVPIFVCSEWEFLSSHGCWRHRQERSRQSTESR